MAILKARKLDYFYQDGDKLRYILKDTNVDFEQGVNRFSHIRLG